MVKRLPDAEIRFYWDDRGKRWTISSTYAQGNQWLRAETTAALDQQGVQKLLAVVKAEMESWLF